MTQGLVLLAAWGQFALVLAVLLFVILRRAGRRG